MIAVDDNTVCSEKYFNKQMKSNGVIWRVYPNAPLAKKNYKKGDKVDFRNLLQKRG